MFQPINLVCASAPELPSQLKQAPGIMIVPITGTVALPRRSKTCGQVPPLYGLGVVTLENMSIPAYVTVHGWLASATGALAPSDPLLDLNLKLNVLSII